MKIGVIAGTPVDTKMGVDYVLSKGHEAVGFACSRSAPEQNEMQILYRDKLLEIAVAGCREMVRQGAEGIFVYCNSLSGAIDIEQLRTALPVRVVTPLDIYRDCAHAYARLAVIAANGSSLAAIERTILSANPDCSVFGAGLLPLVVAIESGTEAGEIYRSFQLDRLTDCFAAVGCDALILGCTHFPYVGDAIRAGFAGEVIDPSEQMLATLVGSPRQGT